MIDMHDPYYRLAKIIESEPVSADLLRHIHDDKYPNLSLPDSYWTERGHGFSSEIREHKYQIYVTSDSTDVFVNVLYVVHIRLKQSMPRLFLNRITNDSEYFANSSYGLGNAHKLSLEGDFYRTHEAYTPTESIIPALQVLAPDLMDALHRSPVPADTEINGKNIFMYIPSDYEIDLHFDKVKKLISQLIEVSEGFKAQEYSDTSTNPVKTEQFNSRSQKVSTVYTILGSLLILSAILIPATIGMAIGSVLFDNESISAVVGALFMLGSWFSAWKLYWLIKKFKIKLLSSGSRKL